MAAREADAQRPEVQAAEKNAGTNARGALSILKQVEPRVGFLQKKTRFGLAIGRLFARAAKATGTGTRARYGSGAGTGAGAGAGAGGAAGAGAGAGGASLASFAKSNDTITKMIAGSGFNLIVNM